MFYQRARSWKRRPTRVIKARFSVNGKNGWHKVEILRRIDPEALKWIGQELVQQELLGLAKRNGWVA